MSALQRHTLLRSQCLTLRPTHLFNLIPNKRESIARVLATSGITTLLEHIGLARQSVLVVFTYHRIADPTIDLFYEPVISATADAFRKQLSWLCNRFQLLTLAELLAYVEGGPRRPEPIVFLTFDDGYRDNFEVAAPILRERNAAATFFISTSFIEATQIPWWDYVAYIIKRTKVPRLTLKRDPQTTQSPLIIDLATISCAGATALIIDAFLNDTIADEAWFLTQLALQAGVDIDPSNLARALFMSWDQVQQLASHGTKFSVGSHACTHRKLAILDDKAQQYELSESKRLLQAQLGCEITTLAYPYGWAGSYSSRTKELAAQVGYRLAFTSKSGLNQLHNLDRFEVSRLGVGSADSTNMLRTRAVLHAICGRPIL